MSTTITERIASWPTLGDDGQKIHLYPPNGTSRPRLGDVARCGYVCDYVFPSDLAAWASGLPECEECVRRSKAAGMYPRSGVGR
jgi:hypothetical protein